MRNKRGMLDRRQVNLSLFAIIVAFLLSSCMGGGAPIYSRERQPTAQRTEAKPVPQTVIRGAEKGKTLTNSAIPPKFYQVIAGDTLYSIAWRYKLDYKELAKWNGIRSPYLIHVGEKLRLTPPAGKPVTVIAKKDKPKPTSKSSGEGKKNTPEIRKATSPKASLEKFPKKLTWQWPAKGKLIQSQTVSGRNGIDIAGKMGQTVRAAASGKVVYSGSGLVGYGNLIIIKHNNSFLSAYAHNSHLLVNEGMRVQSGQPIAEMGNTGTNRVKLHFEIRKDGKSVNPLKYLPKRQD